MRRRSDHPERSHRVVSGFRLWRWLAEGVFNPARFFYQVYPGVTLDERGRECWRWRDSAPDANKGKTVRAVIRTVGVDVVRAYVGLAPCAKSPARTGSAAALPIIVSCGMTPRRMLHPAVAHADVVLCAVRTPARRGLSPPNSIQRIELLIPSVAWTLMLSAARDTPQDTAHLSASYP